MTSTNPEPTRTTAPGEIPATGSASPIYPEEGVAAPSDAQATGSATTQAPPATTQAPVQRTRAASFWVSVVVTALLLIALIVFLAQNSRQISIHFLGWSGQISQAVALLIAAVCGALVVAIPASIRIVQLRHGAKKAARQS
jgi:uncharacterized integral membrane protein